MAQITSAIAAKQLRKLNEQHDALLAMEKKAKNFTAAIQEDVESVRPAYDFKATQDALVEIEEVQVETGYTNWDRSDNEFYCTVAGYDEEGRVILDAKNSVCFDGRNKIQPFFVVDSNTMVEKATSYNRIPGCYVLWHITGMDRNGRFILKTQTEQR